MARKENQHNNCLEHNSIDEKTNFSESHYGSPPERVLECEITDTNEPFNNTQSIYDCEGGLDKVKNVVGRKRSKKSRSMSKEKPVMDRMRVSAMPATASASASSSVRHTERVTSASDGSQLSGDDHASKSPSESSFPFEFGLPSENVINDGSGPFENIFDRNLRATALSILKAVNAWLEKQKPYIIKMTTVLYASGQYLRIRSEQAYPILRQWFVNAGNLMLLIAMVWLDCCLRGVISTFHLGATSFFIVLWCSFLSIIAMAGLLKILMITIVGTLLAVFVGFTLTVLVIAILVTLILWMYGSFWTTALLVSFGGIAFTTSYDRFALFIIALYSIYCAKIYVGWLGLLVGLNLAFISSDVLLHFLKSNVNGHNRTNKSEKQSPGVGDQPSSFNSEPDTVFGRFTDHSAGATSTSGFDADLSSEDEVVRLLNCTDHYSALGLARYENIDVSLLKREYRKKAILVHPDKNMGNEKAAEAFKKLQNAYEILLDSLKRKAYDEELKGEELLCLFRRFQSTSHKSGRHGPSEFTRSEEHADRDSRRIACKKCGSFHTWIQTSKSKPRARWCQECRDFHQAKDGDGWVEQTSQPFLFGLLQKVDPPSAYICAESKIYNASEWFTCQGMRCPPNTHKPSFHVNTSIISKHGGGSTTGSGGSGQRGAAGIPMSDMNEMMTEEEFMNWLQKAMQSGIFEGSTPSAAESPSATSGKFSNNGSSNNSNSKKKKKGKKQR